MEPTPERELSQDELLAAIQRNYRSFLIAQAEAEWRNEDAKKQQDRDSE